jgi:phytoene dehydrogenase-like protein
MQNDGPEGRVTKALDKTYDGIVIGAGHHGLILGSYLAKAGLNILLVDRRLQYGGGLTTKEVTAPGFYHNLHSINHFHISETPWFKDLGLEDRVTYITPRYEFGQAHSDGTALVFGRDREETIANVARFSKKDAETFREWNRRAEEITAQILIPERYAEPLPQAEREALLEKTAIGRDFLAVSRRQPLDVVRDLFENDHVKLLFLFKVSLFGTWLTDTMSKTSPMGSVNPRVRSGNRLPALSGRLVQSCPRLNGNLHRGRWHIRAASRHRPYPDRGRPRARSHARRRPNRSGAAVRGIHDRRASDV